MGGMIRRVVESDVASLVPLMRDYVVDFYRCADPGDASIAEFIRDLLDHPDRGAQWVSDIEGQLAGFATCYWTLSTLRFKRSAILNDLFVSQAYRGRGLGEELFRACLGEVRARGWGPMMWETGHDNEVAQRLYKKMGGMLSPTLHYELE